MRQKNELMGHYIKAGYRDLNSIRKHYNEFSSGGNLYQDNNPNGQQLTRQDIQTQQKVKFLNEINDSQGTNYGIADYDRVKSMMSGKGIRSKAKASSVLSDVALPIVSGGYNFASPIDIEGIFSSGKNIFEGNAEWGDAATLGLSILPAGKYLGKGMGALSKRVRNLKNMSFDDLNKLNAWENLQGKFKKRPIIGDIEYYNKIDMPKGLTHQQKVDFMDKYSGSATAYRNPITNTHTVSLNKPSTESFRGFISETQPGMAIMEEKFITKDGLKLLEGLERKGRVRKYPIEGKKLKLYETFDDGLLENDKYQWIDSFGGIRVKKFGGYLR